ncbi:MAG: replication initiation protein RepC [Methylocella sp.]
MLHLCFKHSHELCRDIACNAKTCLDIVETAAVVRPFIGISPSALEDALDVLGPEDATAVDAVILSRINARKSA